MNRKYVKSGLQVMLELQILLQLCDMMKDLIAVWKTYLVRRIACYAETKFSSNRLQHYMSDKVLMNRKQAIIET